LLQRLETGCNWYLLILIYFLYVIFFLSGNGHIHHPGRSENPKHNLRHGGDGPGRAGQPTRPYSNRGGPKAPDPTRPHRGEALAFPASAPAVAVAAAAAAEMVYFDSWDEFVDRSVQLFRADPITVRRDPPPFLPGFLLPASRSNPSSVLPMFPDALYDEVPALRREARAQGHR
jgi:hypothetical protein